jgi:3-hydroxyisobutyrate dehydrogenase-like beta-hydroxyacid dehydrogenase
MASERTQVCAIGLGKMGSALAEALLKAGHTVTVWNRTPARCDALRAMGAVVAGSVAEAARAADVALVCVTNDAATREIIFTDGVAQALRGKLLIQLSTSTAEQSREIGAWARTRDIRYLEGSILAAPADITSGSAIIAYAGPRETYDQYIDVLSALGGDPKHVSEEIGAAVTFDRTIFTLGYGTMQSFIQGAAIAAAKGFSIEAYTDTAVKRMETYRSRIKWYGDMIAKRDYGNAQASMQTHAAAFAEALAVCREAGVDDTLPAALMHNFQRALATGHGEQELSALFEVLLHSSR